MLELKISGKGKWQGKGDILRRFMWEQSAEQMREEWKFPPWNGRHIRNSYKMPGFIHSFISRHLLGVYLLGTLLGPRNTAINKGGSGVLWGPKFKQFEEPSLRKRIPNYKYKIKYRALKRYMQARVPEIKPHEPHGKSPSGWWDRQGILSLAAYALEEAGKTDRQLARKTRDFFFREWYLPWSK